MLSKRLEETLNKQINAELWSAYLYLSMSADFAAKGYPGFANWMNVQFKEEQDHAMKFMNYVIARGGKVGLMPIAEVKTVWESPLSAYEDALAHELIVTGLINNLNSMSVEEKDYATESMLRWFIDEQVEEEETAQKIIDALKMVKDNGFGLYTLDKELAARVYIPLVIA